MSGPCCDRCGATTAQLRRLVLSGSVAEYPVDLCGDCCRAVQRAVREGEGLVMFLDGAMSPGHERNGR